MSFPEIILLRHSTTEATLNNIISGWNDDKIDIEYARNEIEKLYNQTKKNSIRTDVFENASCLFTSALSRTIHTANILLEYINKKPELIKNSQLLNEKHYGVLSHKNRYELKYYYTEEEINEWRRTFYGKPPNGESMEDVSIRVSTFYDMFIKDNLKKMAYFPDKPNKIIIISHGTPIRCLMSIIENKKDDYYQNLEIPICEGYYYKISFDGRIIEKRNLPQYDLLESDIDQKKIIDEAYDKMNNQPIKLTRRRSSSV